jgi:hypothetical protein
MYKIGLAGIYKITKHIIIYSTQTAAINNKYRGMLKSPENEKNTYKPIQTLMELLELLEIIGIVRDNWI